MGDLNKKDLMKNVGYGLKFGNLQNFIKP